MYKALIMGIALLTVSAALFAGGSTDSGSVSAPAASMAASGEYSEAPMLAAMVAPESGRGRRAPAGTAPVMGRSIRSVLRRHHLRVREQHRAVEHAAGRDRAPQLPGLHPRRHHGGAQPDKGFDLADDFLSLTITLREGAQWSDGSRSPPTTSCSPRGLALRLAGRSGTGGVLDEQGAGAIKIDDYTCAWRPTSLSVMLAKMATGRRRCHSYLPKHYLESSTSRHPTPTRWPGARHDSWSLAFNAHDWEYQTLPPLNDDNEPRPNQQPWKLIEVRHHQGAERTPLQSGRTRQHLPTWTASSPASPTGNIQLKIIAGEVDYDFVNATSDNYRPVQERGLAGLLHEVAGQQIPIAFALTRPTREGHIFRDLRFRQAMSLQSTPRRCSTACTLGSASHGVPGGRCTFSPPE